MKRFFISVLVFILAVGAAAAGAFIYFRYWPSNRQADPADWFGAAGPQVALVLDNELENEAQGRYINGQTYLPLSWVNEYLNERFYWDSQAGQIIYALPESIEYTDQTVIGSSGTPLVIRQDEEVWLAPELVVTYTDIRISLYDEGEVKRAFIDSDWAPLKTARIKKDGQVRVLGGNKSAVLTEVLKDSEVTILDATENWTRVRTTDGFLGYIQNKLLSEPKEQTIISNFIKPVYKSIALAEPVVLAWHQVTVPDANNAMEQLLANTKGVNVIAPTWFMLTDNDGNYESLANREYVDKAHAKGIQVWAVLDNFNQGENVRSEILFASTQARTKLTEQLMKDVKTYNLDGINLDVEMIKAEAGPHYVQFIRELSVACRKAGVILSVDNAIPVATSMFYNRAEQGQVADYVIIMGYDEHTSGDEKGSSSSYDFVREGIRDTLAAVPKEKVINAVPFYTRLWKTDAEGNTSSSALGISAAAKWVQDNQVELYWQEELGQYYGELTIGSDDYCMWLEEKDSLARKMELIYENGLAGVAVWKLGLEPADIWNVVLDGLEGKSGM